VEAEDEADEEDSCAVLDMVLLLLLLLLPVRVVYECVAVRRCCA
jgi:hypothetical protein